MFLTCCLVVISSCFFVIALVTTRNKVIYLITPTFCFRDDMIDSRGQFSTIMTSVSSNSKKVFSKVFIHVISLNYIKLYPPLIPPSSSLALSSSGDICNFLKKHISYPRHCRFAFVQTSWSKTNKKPTTCNSVTNDRLVVRL